jgi:hypothetical protein
MRHHIVYETENLLNGAKYIGKHSTDNLDDGYLGSGIAISKDIKEYGKENFKRTILKEFQTEQEAFAYEKELVTKEIVHDSNYYNLVVGGTGFGFEWYKTFSYKTIPGGEEKIEILREEFKEKMSKISSEWFADPKNKEKFIVANIKAQGTRRSRKNKSEAQKRRYKDSKERKKLSKAQKLRLSDPEKRAKYLEILNSPDVNEKRSKTVKAWFADPENKKEHIKRMKECSNRPECKKKRSESMKGKNAKLTEEQVIDIKTRLKSGEKHKSIAKRYNVAPPTISSISIGKSWSYVTI